MYNLVLLMLVGGVCGSNIVDGNIFSSVASAATILWIMFGPSVTGNKS